MTRLKLTSALLLILTMASCREGHFCEKGSGPQTTSTRDLPPIDGVDLEIAADLTIIRDTTLSEPYIDIDAQSGLHHNLLTTVRNGRLLIKWERCVNTYRSIRLTLYTPALSSIELSGSGSIDSESAFPGDEFNVSLTGSGKIFSAIRTLQCNSRIEGSGEIELWGSAVQSDIHVDGSGDFHGYELEAVDCYVRITGSGDVEVDVADKLDVEISGSGNVLYEGNPTVSSQISGSGSVKQRP